MTRCGTVTSTLLLFALWVPAAPAQTYKCVDERGVVQYTDKPGPACKAVDIRPSPPISGQVRRQPEDFARQEADFRRRQSELEASAAAEREHRQELETRCQRMLQELAIVTSGRRIYDMDASGDRVYMEDATRDRRAADLREQLRGCP